jgi:hypothetical protein
MKKSKMNLLKLEIFDPEYLPYRQVCGVLA